MSHGQVKFSAKQHHIQNYFYADILTTAHNSQVLTSLCKHCPLSKKCPQKKRNKHFNAYLYLTSIRRETENNKITLQMQKWSCHEQIVPCLRD